MRDMREGVCALCENPEVIEAKPEEWGSSGRLQLVAAWTKTKTFAGVMRAHGLLTFYICRSCGYTQWFTTDPEKVPIGEEHGTSLVRPPHASPFR